MTRPRIAIGADELGYPLKDALHDHLVDQGYHVVDFGVGDGERALYPDIGHAVASAVAQGRCDRGIVICGTGIGMCISANKVLGIRAAVCHDLYSAERSRKSNDCQVMALGARIVGAEFAKSLVELWLCSEFQYGCSTSKVRRQMELERGDTTGMLAASGGICG
jgi:ribose 5-phosphate isomerase B